MLQFGHIVSSLPVSVVELSEDATVQVGGLERAAHSLFCQTRDVGARKAATWAEDCPK